MPSYTKNKGTQHSSRKQKLSENKGSRFKNLPAAAPLRELQLQRRGTWAASFSAWGLADADPTSAVAGGADAPRTLLVPLGVELLSNLCTAVNPAFDS